MNAKSLQQKPLTSKQMLDRLKSREVQFSPLEIKWKTFQATEGPDASATVTWSGKTFPFIVEVKSRSIPKVFAEALNQAKKQAAARDSNPMIVLPYLSPARLDELERAGTSGVDLCGNFLVLVPGKLLVLKSGAPNQYQESYLIKNVYRGTTSLVARALLLRPWTESLEELSNFIRSRGGEITLTTISKALRTMEEDILIERSGGKARLLQPDQLLRKLSDAYRPPRINRKLLGSVPFDRTELCERFSRLTTRVALTGQSSTDRHAVMGREDRTRFYCESIAPLKNSLDQAFKLGDRFANLELLETDDQTVYFDVRQEGSIPIASPVQTFLELSAGDKREQETAEQVRTMILGEARKLSEPA